jgi:hypothetical protein
MNIPCILLAFAAIMTLKLGYDAWRDTSSKITRINTFVGAAALAFGAYGATKPGGTASASIIAFFVAMVFGGSGVGLYFRSRSNPDLAHPSALLIWIAAIALIAATVCAMWR